jgi:hypothetical protein
LHHRRVVALLVFALANTSLGAPPATRDPAPVAVDRIVAVVENGCITYSALQLETSPGLAKLMKQYAGNPDVLIEKQRELERATLTEMVNRRLLASSWERPSFQQIESAISGLAQEAGVGVPELMAEATKAGFSEGEYRRRMAEIVGAFNYVAEQAKWRVPRWRTLDEAGKRAAIAKLTTELAAELRRNRHVRETL